MQTQSGLANGTAPLEKSADPDDDRYRLPAYGPGAPVTRDRPVPVQMFTVSAAVLVPFAIFAPS